MKQFFLCSFLVISSSLFGQKVLKLDKFKDLTTEKLSKPVLVESFDRGWKGWKVGEGFSLKKGEGVTGTTALCYERRDPKNNKVFSRFVELDPGVRYRLSVQYRTELKKDINYMELCALTYYKDGKRQGGSFKGVRQYNSPKWSTMEILSRPGAKKAKVSLFLRSLRTGKIWYDNLLIEPLCRRSAYLYPIAPKCLRLDDKGRVVFKVVTIKKHKNLNYSVLANVGGVTKLLPVKNGIAEGEFGKFKPGKVKVSAKLLDLKNKTIVCKDSCNMFAGKTKNIKGKVTFDSNNRAYIDGKPFLPIGIFVGYVKRSDKDAVKRIREAGFNTILTNGMYMALGGKKKTDMETLKASLDVLEKNNLKFIYSIKYQVQVPGLRNAKKKMDKVEGIAAVTDYIVNGIKDNPVLLGWYISDENPITDLPAVRKLREQIAELDPNHPTITLTNQIGNLLEFAPTGDIISNDEYPIGMNDNCVGPKQTISACGKHLAAAKKTGLPVWWVPQIFSWASFRKTQKILRYPTEEEIRSMILLGAVKGAKGYLLYAYHPIFYYGEARFKGSAEKNWKNVVPSVKLLRELEPWLLSEKSAPKVSVKHLKGEGVEARAFLNDENKIVVIVTADGPGNVEAEIFVPGYGRLKSKYGRLTNLTGGKYLFKGVNVSSDVLQ